MKDAVEPDSSQLACKQAHLKGGGTPEFKGNFGKFKERLKGKKRIMEHHQTVALFAEILG